MKSVNVFAFTHKLKMVMKGNELELWIAPLTPGGGGGGSTGDFRLWG